MEKYFIEFLTDSSPKLLVMTLSAVQLVSVLKQWTWKEILSMILFLIRFDPTDFYRAQILFQGTGPLSSRMLHVRNAPSPACTASLAIAEMVVDEIEEKLLGIAQVQVEEN